MKYKIYVNLHLIIEVFNYRAVITYEYDMINVS